ncbi:MAG: superoxide dismutase [Ni] [Planctomycetota bacterium]|jgi:nickel superoxide dismutase
MRKVIGNKSMVLGVLVVLMVFATIVYSHCQIPCGIYDDPARFDMLAEHINTIEKSMKQITELSQKVNPSFNQVVRWIQNKDNHADQLSDIVTYYFMAQRLKPVDKTKPKAREEYINKLTLLHEMLVYSMKAKQTTDLANVEKLRTLLAQFRAVYFGESSHEH